MNLESFKPHWEYKKEKDERVSNAKGDYLKACVNELEELKKWHINNKKLDTEAFHIYADEILLDALRHLGHNDIVKAYEECESIGFWYA